MKIFLSAILLAVGLLFDVTHCKHSPAEVDWSQFNPDHQKELNQTMKIFASSHLDLAQYHIAFRNLRLALYSIHPEAADIFLQQTVFLAQSLLSSEVLRSQDEQSALVGNLRRLRLLVNGETFNWRLIEATSSAMRPPSGQLRLHFPGLQSAGIHEENVQAKKRISSASLDSLVGAFILDGTEEYGPLVLNLDPAQLRHLFLVAFAPRILAAYRFVYQADFPALVKRLQLQPGSLAVKASPLLLGHLGALLHQRRRVSDVKTAPKAPKSPSENDDHDQLDLEEEEDEEDGGGQAAERSAAEPKSIQHSYFILPYLALGLLLMVGLVGGILVYCGRRLATHDQNEGEGRVVKSAKLVVDSTNTASS